MRVLVTGGAGFIGSHLVNELQRRGHYVRVLDDLSSGDPTRLSDGINLNRGDVRDVPKLWSLLQGMDVVYHLAARISLPASVLYPREYNDVNVGGTVSLLEACRDVGSIKRVVLASSATVYGEHSQQPVDEKMATYPALPYAVSKIASEQYLFTMGRLSGFETVALRIFNAFGPGQPLPPVHAPLIPHMLQQIVGKGSMVIYGDGSQTRDFVYIDDVVAALISAGQAVNVDREIINVGSGVETSVNELASTMSAITGHKADLIYNREAGGGLARLVADLTKAKQLLGFDPRTQLDAGLRKLLEIDPIFARRKRKFPLTQLGHGST
jgi:UDP-glucose 4-epimerase